MDMRDLELLIYNNRESHGSHSQRRPWNGNFGPDYSGVKFLWVYGCHDLSHTRGVRSRISGTLSAFGVNTDLLKFLARRLKGRRLPPHIV